MSNSAFKIAIQTRLLLNIANNKPYCLCGEYSGPFFSHQAHCTTNQIRAPVRNKVHSLFKSHLMKILQYWNSKFQLNFRFSYEPFMKDYFETSSQQPTSIDQRGDILIHDVDNGKFIIIDVTTTEACKIHSRSQKYSHPGCVAELRVNEKMRSYNGWILQPSINSFQVISAELQGVLDSASYNYLSNLLIPPSDNKTEHLKLLRQQLSVALQGLRAEAIAKAILHALPYPPEIRLIPA